MRRFISSRGRGATRLSSVVVLLADGVRPDTLRSAMDRGELPALAALRSDGALETVVTAFPSVTGVAYVPMLTGLLPGPAGVPGLRWYDRRRQLSALTGHARSYVGVEARAVDTDLAADVPTLFELAPGQSLGSLTMLARGLPARNRITAGAGFAARSAWTHVRGDARGWLDIDRRAAGHLVSRIRRDRPRFVFAAFLGPDKAAHAAGHDSPLVLEALRTLDQAASEIRRDAERDGRWRNLHLWVVSDHGHAPVGAHDELVTVLRGWGLRVMAHPWVFRGADVALMVSGNAMAHVYVELERRERAFWPALRDRWGRVVSDLVERQSVDLAILPHGDGCAEVRGRGRGSAMLEWNGGRYAYRPCDGDPLGIGPIKAACAGAALEATVDGNYPDAIVQIASIASAARAGDVILSAAPGWDFRERYEPMPHRSTHGALHRDHMLVPLLLNRSPARTPARTVDIMPSVLRVLGTARRGEVDGEAFV